MGNETGLLGHGQKLVGRKQAPHRVLPTHQRFECSKVPPARPNRPTWK
jgi:hypothetical protein